MKKSKIKNKRTSLSHERNLGTMKLLVSYSDFQKIVVEMRNRLKIPTNGFLKEDIIDIRNWHNYLLVESDEVMASKSFLEQEKRIGQNFAAKAISRKMANKQMGLLYEKIPLNYLHNRIFFIIDKFNLPIHHRDYIKNHIIYGEIDAPSYNYSIGPYKPSESPKRARHIPITIYTRLDQKEVKELKRVIDMAGKNIPKYNVIGNIDKKLTIEEWYENREKIDEADYNTYKMSNAEIAENVLGSRRKGKEVYDIQKCIKALREKRFGNGKKQA